MIPRPEDDQYPNHATRDRKLIRENTLRRFTQKPELSPIDELPGDLDTSNDMLGTGCGNSNTFLSDSTMLNLNPAYGSELGLVDFDLGLTPNGPISQSEDDDLSWLNSGTTCDQLPTDVSLPTLGDITADAFSLHDTQVVFPPIQPSITLDTEQPNTLLSPVLATQSKTLAPPISFNPPPLPLSSMRMSNVGIRHTGEITSAYHHGREASALSSTTEVTDDSCYSDGASAPTAHARMKAQEARLRSKHSFLLNQCLTELQGMSVTSCTCADAQAVLGPRMLLEKRAEQVLEHLSRGYKEVLQEMKVVLLPKRRRRAHPPRITKVLTSWFNSHVAHPFPTDEEKEELGQQTGLSVKQVSDWFSNKRSRTGNTMSK